MFIDIDHTGCTAFTWLMGVLINCQDGISIDKASSKLECNVTSLYKNYNIGERLNEILLDVEKTPCFKEAECCLYVVQYLLKIGMTCQILLILLSQLTGRVSHRMQNQSP